MKKRIVVEMETTNDEITEGSCKRLLRKLCWPCIRKQLTCTELFRHR